MAHVNPLAQATAVSPQTVNKRGSANVFDYCTQNAGNATITVSRLTTATIQSTIEATVTARID